MIEFCQHCWEGKNEKNQKREGKRLTSEVYWSVLCVAVSVRRDMSKDRTVLFTGNVTHKLDPKSRVAIPAGWRAAQGEVLVMIEAHSEGCRVLKCYTQESFAEKIEAIRGHAREQMIPPGEVDQYVGKITGCSFEAEVSTQGKLLIPKPQRERMKLEETATIVGRGTFFEIWNPADYESTHTADALSKLKLDQIFHILS